MKKLLTTLAFLCCLSTVAYATDKTEMRKNKAEILKKDQQLRKSKEETISPALKRQIHSAWMQAIATDKVVVLDSIILQSPNGELMTKQTFSVDPAGQTTQIDYGWDILAEKWNLSGKNIYAFDKNGNRILNIMYSWDGLEWSESIKQEYIYDDNRFELLNELYDWDEQNNDWIGNSKVETKYDQSGRITLKLSYNWDQQNNNWRRDNKTETKYDDKGRQTLLANYNDWDEQNNDWIGSNKIETKYDQNENVTLNTQSWGWDTDNNDWIISSGEKYDYDYNTQNKVTSAKFWMWNLTDKAWYWVNTATYHYSDSNPTAIEEGVDSKTTTIICYPNPTANGLYIKGIADDSASFEIYDLSGQKLRETSVADNDFVDISSLAEGTYIVKINSSTMSIEQKIIKK